jgi:hypothetical protein
MTNFSPREIVSELDRYIVGQKDAKRAVAIALRNRWRRQQLTGQMREEVMPKNILMIGPTGVGKTEISRRLAKLAGAPFIKVEATKFTEVGYVGRDVEQIVRDLVEVAIVLVREKMREDVKARAHLNAEERVLEALVGKTASPATRDSLPQEAARRRARRQGDRDRGGRYWNRRHARLRDPRHAGRQYRRAQHQRHAVQGDGSEAHQDAQDDGEGVLRASDRRRVGQAARPGSGDRGRAPVGARTTASSSSTRSTRSQRVTVASERVSPAKACSATCCRWSRARRSRPNTGR